MPVVPTDEAYRIALSNGVHSTKIRKIGIPVHPDLLQEKRSKEEIRAALGWEVDKTTLLVVGSKRVSNLVRNLRGINHLSSISCTTRI